MPDIGLGQECNNCCIMCTNAMPLPANYGELTTDDIIRKIDRCLDEPTGEAIILTGGEPTIRKDLFEIIGHIRNLSRAREIKIITNARMFAYPDFARKIAEHNLSVITELHGSNADMHDKITKVGGSFEQAVAGIKNMLDLSMRVELRIVVSKLNYKDVPDIARMYRKEFNKAAKFVIFPIDIIGNAYKNRDETIVSYTDMVPYVEEAAKILGDVELFHIPYCVIDKRYWSLIKGVTVPERRITFAEVCKGCIFEEKCPRVWRTYAKIVGTGEFRRLTDGSAKS